MQATFEISGAGFGFRCAPFYADDLRRIGAMRLEPVRAAIRQGRLANPEPDWSLGESAISTVFGLRHRPHMFEARPISWGRVRFTEPQFTVGLAHFLNAPALPMRTETVYALLKGLGVPVPAKECMKDIDVKAEAKAADGKRVDLLVQWKDNENRCHAAAVEAKVGHKVTCGQLAAYRAHLCDLGLDCRRRLVVVSPRRTKDVNKELGRNPEWRWISWHGLLVAHERALPIKCDDEAYRQFRNTLWHQTGWW